MTDYRESIKKYIEKESNVLNDLPVDDINNVLNVLEKARLSHKRIFICGNGGSASTAAHFECDFNKGVSYEQEVKYDFECLSDNVPMMMAIANDISYNDIFLVPLRNKMKKGDIVIGISGSGNSENVIRAIKYANENGGITIAFTGFDGGKVKKLAKYGIHINVNDMQITEDMHLVIDHLMMSVLSKYGIDIGIS